MSDDWLDEPRYERFRRAFSYALSHFAQAAGAFGKVTRKEAWWIHRTIQRGFEVQARTSDEQRILVLPKEVWHDAVDAMQSRGLHVVLTPEEKELHGVVSREAPF